MTLTQLKYACEAAKAGSINAAAERCFVSQSVMSTAIRKLEEELQHPIFTRSGKGVALTPFGKTFIEYTVPMLEHAKLLENLIERDEPSPELLRIASSGWEAVSSILGERIRRQNETGIRVEYYEHLDGEVMQMVSSRTVDAGFIRRYSCYRNQNRDACRSMHIHFEELLKADLGVTVSSANPLFTLESDYVEPEQLAGCAQIVWNYTDEVLFADLMKRLRLPQAKTRVIMNARAAVDDILQQTPSYYIDTVFPKKQEKMKLSNDPKTRTLILKGCTVYSEFGWVRRKDVELSPAVLDLVEQVKAIC